MAEIDNLVARWCECERRGDAAALDALLHDGFRGRRLTALTATRANRQRAVTTIGPAAR